MNKPIGFFWVVSGDNQYSSPPIPSLIEAQKVADSKVIETGMTHHILSAQCVGTVVRPLAQVRSSA